MPANRSQAVASLRRRLLSWILWPLMGLIGVNAWVGYGNAVQAANEAYDRSLYLAARTWARACFTRSRRLAGSGWPAMLRCPAPPRVTKLR